MNKVVYVPAFFRNGSDSIIDDEALAENVRESIEELNQEGYEVLSVTPVTSAEYKSGGEYNLSYGYGYSYTSSLIIIAKRI